MDFLEEAAIAEGPTYRIGPRECERFGMGGVRSSDKSLHCAATAVGSTKSLNRSRSTVF